MKMFSVFILTLSMTAVAAESTLQELTKRQNFLTEVLIRVQTEAILNHEAVKRIVGCMNRTKKTPDCEIARAQVLAPFPQIVSEARLHLAMGYRDGLFAGGFSRINSKLSPLGTYKDIKWEPLTAKEEAVATTLMNRYVAAARAEASKNPKIGQSGAKHERFVNLAVREKRLNHLNVYKNLISHIVLLQYMRDERVNDSTLREAFARLLDRSTKEINTLSKAAVSAENWVKSRVSCAETIDYQLNNPSPYGGMSYCINTPSSLLSLLDYKAAIDGVILENPSYSKTLKNLQSERTGRSILTAAMIGLPTLAICVLAPPLVAIPVGAASGGLALLDAQNEYNKIRRRELSTVINASGAVDWNALKGGRMARNISVALVPFFGAGKYVSPIMKSATKPAGKYISGMMKLKYYRVTRS